MHITVSFDKTKKQSNGCCSSYASTKIRAVLTLYKPCISKQNYFDAKKIMKIDSL